MSLEADLKGVMSKYVEAPKHGSLGRRGILETSGGWKVVDFNDETGEHEANFESFADLCYYLNNTEKWESFFHKAAK